MLLGKVDLALETFGDIFRAPDDGNRYLLESRSAAAGADGASFSDSSALSEVYGDRRSVTQESRRGSSSPSSNMKRGSIENSGKSATRKSNLSTRTGLDFWVPMMVAGAHGTIAHAGELRLRVLILPIPPTHRLAAQYSWLSAPLPLMDTLGRAGGSSSSGGNPTSSGASSSAVKVVECRDESAEDRRTLYSFLLARLARARRARASAAASSQHRIAASDVDGGMGGGPDSGPDDSGDDGDQDDGNSDGDGKGSGRGSGGGGPANGLGKDGVLGGCAALLSDTFDRSTEGQPPVPTIRYGNGSAGGAGATSAAEARASTNASVRSSTVDSHSGRSRRRQRQRQGLLTLRVEER